MKKDKWLSFRRFKQDLDKTVFFISASIAVLFIGWGLASPESLGTAMDKAYFFLTFNFNWAYLLLIGAFLVFAVAITISPWGKIKLGKPEEKPEFSNISYFTMMFSAAIAAGIVFWAPAEALLHYAHPPAWGPAAGTNEAILFSLRQSFFHWGLHAWAIYMVVAVPVAYFSFRKNLPLRISTTLYPLIGEKGIYGPIGKIIDIFAVLATIGGVSTTVGLCALQISSGLEFAFGVPKTTLLIAMIILILTICYTTSVVSGVHKGIKWISNFNIGLAILLCFFVFFTSGYALFSINLGVNTLGSYIQNISWMTFWTDPVERSGWLGSWTTFYWAWWLAWAPFVGLFEARVSRGRTIREFFFYAVLVNTIVTFIWFSIFSGTSLGLEHFQHAGLVQVLEEKGTESALFAIISHLPAPRFMSALSLVLVTTFFVTSADSSTLGLSQLTTGGRIEPVKEIRLFWGITLGVISLLVTIIGGVHGLQTASIITGGPFAIIMVFMIWAMIKEFSGSKER